MELMMSIYLIFGSDWPNIEDVPAIYTNKKVKRNLVSNKSPIAPQVSYAKKASIYKDHTQKIGNLFSKSLQLQISFIQLKIIIYMSTNFMSNKL